MAGYKQIFYYLCRRNRESVIYTFMNPFNYISVAEGDNFYDRKDETERIVNTLAGGNNIVLFAPRRYGKTSLARKSMQVLERQGIRCAYMDLMPVYSLESFVQLYLQSLYKKQTMFEKFIQLVSTLKNIRPKMTFDNEGKPQFGIDFIEPTIDISTVAQVLDLPEKLSAEGQRMVVVLDEFQEIRRLSKYNLEALIRSKIQLQHNVNYLFLGSKTHLMQDMFMSKNRPFYQSAFTLQITTLPEEDTCNFLIQKFNESNIEISLEQCKHIISLTDNIPYYIQLLAAEVWQYMMPDKKQVSESVINECFTRIIQLKQDYYSELLFRLSNLQKRLLKAVSYSGKNIFSANYLSQHRLGSASSVQKALLVLLEEGLLEKEGDCYFLSDPFLKRYLANYAL